METAVPYTLTGYNIINGTAAAETLTGTAGKDAIYGNGGADVLNGGLGADVLFGGTAGGVTFQYSIDGTWTAGMRAVNSGDPLAAGPGTSFDLTGYGQTHDVFVGAGTNNTLQMGDGHNALFLDDGLSPGLDSIRLVNIQTIQMGSGGQIVDLTSSTASYGNVTIIGANGDDVIMANAGNDTLRGGDGKDYIWGGSGNDQIYGEAGADTLLGGTGNDTLDGGTGADSMTGGAGDDTYSVDDAADVVVEASSQGLDRVIATISHVLAANVEQLTLAGTAAINGTGNTLANTLTGNAASNVLDGGAGTDTMIGGLGSDTYVVDSTGDIVTELAGQGTDQVNASITYTLGTNVENLTLIGTGNINGTGNALNNVITGNSGNNALSGGLGADYLDGGTGRDAMTGGDGNDTYVVDNSTDTTIETATGGVDLVLSKITHTLQANVENLTLTGTSAINGTGNALDNVITGNAAANTLTGLDGNDKLNGGAGNDTLSGGNGNDQMFGEDGNDTITGGEGNDLLNGGYGLDTLRGGNGNDGFFGGGSNDTIYGEAGNDNIYGDGGNDKIYGGAGSDLLAGGQLKNGFSLGNDTFAWMRADVVNSSGASQGFDRVVDFGAGDKIDFSGLSLGSSPIASVVRVTDTGAGTVISANFGGTTGFVDVVVLDGVHHVTLADMVSDGAIVV
jgi:Ca2+-binding RTX toxin-like protein